MRARDHRGRFTSHYRPVRRRHRRRVHRVGASRKGGASTNLILLLGLGVAGVVFLPKLLKGASGKVAQANAAAAAAAPVTGTTALLQTLSKNLPTMSDAYGAMQSGDTPTAVPMTTPTASPVQDDTTPLITVTDASTVEA